LDSRPGAGILQDPKVANYTLSQFAPGYRNISKPIIEQPRQRPGGIEILKEIEKRRAEDYFDKSNPARFISYAGLADEEERREHWTLLTP
jgi:hypothetical protein